MAKEKGTKAEIIAASGPIIASYGSMRLTVRQLYYQLVTRGVIANSVKAYKRVVSALTDARREGTIEYDSIEDRNRTVHIGDREEDEDPEEYLSDWIDTIKRLDEVYTIPKWYGQPVRVQVWVEKEALSGLFRSVTDELGVDLVICKGYPSLSLLYQAAGVLDDADKCVERLQIIYFGDFDPSGMDIERFVGDSLSDDFGVEIDVERVAITRDQIEKYNIPPEPAKLTDSRYDQFMSDEGVAWQVELDALEPRILQSMIREAVKKHFDEDLGEDRDDELDQRREKLKDLLKTTLKEAFGEE